MYWCTDTSLSMFLSYKKRLFLYPEELLWFSKKVDKYKEERMYKWIYENE